MYSGILCTVSLLSCMTNTTEHIFVCMMAIWIFICVCVCMKWMFISFVCFIACFLLIFRNSGYKSLVEYMFYDYLLSVCDLSSFLTMSFNEHRFLFSIIYCLFYGFYFQLSIVYFMISAYFSLCRKYLPTISHYSHFGD